MNKVGGGDSSSLHAKLSFGEFDWSLWIRRAYGLYKKLWLDSLEAAEERQHTCLEGQAIAVNGGMTAGAGCIFPVDQK